MFVCWQESVCFDVCRESLALKVLLVAVVLVAPEAPWVLKATLDGEGRLGTRGRGG